MCIVDEGNSLPCYFFLLYATSKYTVWAPVRVCNENLNKDYIT